jgi:hypothetical protein
MLCESYSAHRPPPTIRRPLCREHLAVFNKEGFAVNSIIYIVGLVVVVVAVLSFFGLR